MVARSSRQSVVELVLDKRGRLELFVVVVFGSQRRAGNQRRERSSRTFSGGRFQQSKASWQPETREVNSDFQWWQFLVVEGELVVGDERGHLILLWSLSSFFLLMILTPHFIVKIQTYLYAKSSSDKFDNRSEFWAQNLMDFVLGPSPTI